MLYSCQYDYIVIFEIRGIPWNFSNHFGIYNPFRELSVSINVDGWWVKICRKWFSHLQRNEPFSIDNASNYIAFERTFSHIFRPPFTIQASRTSRRVGVTAVFLVCRISIYSKYTRSIIRQITFEMLFRILCSVFCVLCTSMCYANACYALKKINFVNIYKNREHFPCSCSAFVVPFFLLPISWTGNFEVE